MSYYKIDNLEQYFKHYNKSIREPRKFWGKIAEENFTWYQQWDKVVEFNMGEAEIKWFTEAKVNIVLELELFILLFLLDFLPQPWQQE